MSFTSFSYLLFFLPAVALANATLRRFGPRRSAVWLLLASSLGFYVLARPEQVGLLLGSILVNWFIAGRIGVSAGTSSGRRWLWFGIAANLAFLAAFKYINFFFAQIDGLAGLSLDLPNWAAPLGVSFFTFAQIMYLIDCEQGLHAPVGLIDHATATALFPYIASGPIVRIAKIGDQFREADDDSDRWQMAQRGMLRLGIGFAKKVLLADSLIQFVNAGFGAPDSLSTFEAWVVSFIYTLQIYFDFSGYSDMAIGSALLLGLKIPENFNSPYVAKSVSEFWQRWHMSLSNFITNYLYTPILRAQKRATLRASAIAVMLAMGICGLWHGAAWTYVVWGLMHGAALAVNQFWRKSKRKLPPGVGWIVTLLFVDLALVVFRAPSLPAAAHFYAALLPQADLLGVQTLTPLLPAMPAAAVRPALLFLVVVPFALIQLFYRRGPAWVPQIAMPIKVVAYSVMLYLALFLGGEPTAFVYFQF